MAGNVSGVTLGGYRVNTKGYTRVALRQAFMAQGFGALYSGLPFSSR